MVQTKKEPLRRKGSQGNCYIEISIQNRVIKPYYK